MRTAIYTRISQDRNGDQLGVGRQITDCYELAGRRRWEVIGQYIDNDISAFSGKLRPEYRRLLADVEAGVIQAILAWHPDRLHRSPVELESFIDLVEKHGVAVATVQGGDYDLGTASGRMTARVVGAVARHDSEHNRERVRRKMAELAQNGKDHGGPRPFGWQADRRTVEPAEAYMIREATRHVLDGDSLRSICADWNRRGLLSSTGTSWGTASLRRVLRSARISGRAEHRGRIVAEETSWEPIISIEDSDRLRALLGDPARRPGRPSEYLLTGGIARCGLCGASLVTHPRGKLRRLECVSGPGFKGCGRLGIAAEGVEELVSEAVLRRVDEGALKALLADKADPALLESLAKVERKLTELAVMWAEDQLTRTEFEAARAVHLSAQKDLSRRLEASRRQVGLEGLDEPVRQGWPTLPLARKRAVIKALVGQVVIGPTTRPGFDPERVNVSWRA